MRRVQIIVALVAIGLLAGCGVPPMQEEIAIQPTRRPTAYILPTAPLAVEPAVPAASTQTASESAETPATPEPAESLAKPEPAETLPTPEPVQPAPGDPQGSADPGVAPPEQAATPLPAVPANEPEYTSAGQKPAEPMPAQRPPDVIAIDAPQPGTAIASPVTSQGSTNFWPFEATLGGVLKDASGNILAQFPVTVHSPDMGQGGPWSEQIAFIPPATEQEGTIEVFDASAKDGSITSIASVKVRLVPAPPPGTSLQFDQPEEGSNVVLPLHVAFGGARGDERLVLRLAQADGTVLTQDVRADLGYVVAALSGNGVPGLATLEVARPDGTLLARRTVRIIAPEETQVVKVAWIVSGTEEIVLAERRVPRTPQIATAALNELLWGPDAADPAYSTSLPTPAEVLSYDGRAAGWGPRVRLLKLTITDGVALANFSQELRAYGGGAARVEMIRKQIEATLLQFPSVKQVVIAIEGQTEGVLQP